MLRYIVVKHLHLKNSISLNDWDTTPFAVQSFIRLWKKQYYPTENEILNLAQSIELLSDVTRNFHKDNASPTRFYNNIMMNIDSVIGWDDDGQGSQLIDSLYYEIQIAIKHLLRIRGNNEH